ncbi:hypothetical protein NE237_002615 [Protea cynaroides]|uniref:Uncharacterized protein n=1 Tax=Protea cynaroides TaxID=273540 RepID=A0A9Q0KVQ9_9MAGN|nr:hypothetical protein NE237_002615 [Protea cynaroides]
MNSVFLISLVFDNLDVALNSKKVKWWSGKKNRLEAKASGGRRSKQAEGKAQRTSSATTKRRFWWIHKALFCNFVRKLKPRSSCPNWRRWFLFLQMGFGRKVDSTKDSAFRESKPEEIDEDSD